MIKLIIFDWDDVFTIGSKEGYFKCYHETLLELGVHLEPEEEKRRILAKWSKPHREELRELFKEKPVLLDKACRIYEGKLFGNTFTGALRILGGTAALLERLNGKYALCIATGLHPRLLKEKIMPKFKVPNVFSQVISTYDIKEVEKQKPSPFMLEQIMKKQNASPGETVFVGDAKTDVLMARNAKVKPVVVLTGHLSRKEAEELKVNCIIEDVTHLEEALSELNKSAQGRTD
jgi:phosphoglycolate phosphatase-like HAD superfamily hydrolase